MVAGCRHGPLRSLFGWVRAFARRSTGQALVSDLLAVAGVAERVGLAAAAGAEGDDETVRPDGGAVVEHDLHRAVDQQGAVGHLADPDRVRPAVAAGHRGSPPVPRAAGPVRSGRRAPGT